ncbi:GNAT family N-acetyltransferase [Nonomuraea sp. LPB2021202275-12-8]|uniref:GNAT family N-acetyltransferase n=1 Tax=Nonomuraea sp. LPB2021202275-12-8 TaxID=3120159 RepID=UPI00300CDAF8
MILRLARADDADMIARIWHQGWRDGHLGHVPDELVAARTAEAFHVRSSERISDTTVAVAEGAVVGFTMVVMDEVEQIYVAEQQRGTGVAAVLLSEATYRVAANGYKRAWLAVASGNTRARRFYARNGWIDDGPYDYPAASAAGPIIVPCHRYSFPAHPGGPTRPLAG